MDSPSAPRSDDPPIAHQHDEARYAKLKKIVERACTHISTFLDDPDRLDLLNQQYRKLVADANRDTKMGLQLPIDHFVIQPADVAAFKNMRFKLSIANQDEIKEKYKGNERYVGVVPYKYSDKKGRPVSVLICAEKAVDDLPFEYLQKIIGHEVAHVLHDARDKAVKKHLSPEALVAYNHVRELAADRLSDVIEPKLSIAKVLEKQAVDRMGYGLYHIPDDFTPHSHVHSKAYVEHYQYHLRLNDFITAKAVAHVPDSDTHPSDHRRITESRNAEADLAMPRYQAYLENLYDMAVPVLQDTRPITVPQTARPV